MRVGLVVGLLALVLIIGGVAYYYRDTLGRLTSNGMGGPSSPITIESAQLTSGGHLLVLLFNGGQSSTQTIEVTSACSPDFTDCESVNAATGTFVLPPGSRYQENLTIPQQGFAPDISPGWGSPIPGQTYYFKLSVTLAGGSSVSLPVSAVASGKFSYTNLWSAPIQHDTIALTSVGSPSIRLFSNLTGRLTVVAMFDRYPTTTVTTSILGKPDYSMGFPVRSPIISITGNSCSSPSCPIIIGGGGNSLTFSTGFSTVTTGIASNTYYMVTVSVDRYGTYFMWVKTS